MLIFHLTGPTARASVRSLPDRGRDSCPKSGRDVAIRTRQGQSWGVPTELDPRSVPSRPGRARPRPRSTAVAHEELVRELSRTTGLPVNVSARVVDDVLAYFDETVEEFVRRRHRELQRRGHTNDRIFERISTELADRRVRPGGLSQRQLRRLVYG